MKTSYKFGLIGSVLILVIAIVSRVNLANVSSRSNTASVFDFISNQTQLSSTDLLYKDEVNKNTNSIDINGVFNRINDRGYTSLFSASHVMTSKDDIGSNSLKKQEIIKDKYIVELSEKPLAILYGEIQDLKTKGDSENSNSSSQRVVKLAGTQNDPTDNSVDQLSTQREKIKKQQREFFANLSDSIKNKNSEINGAIESENSSISFNTSVNALVLNLDSDEVKKVQKMSGVKNIDQVKIYHINLMDSVPLIGADKIWNGSYPGGQPNVGFTGKGVKIGIIDTGIDYTHSDLGGCFGPSCHVAGGYDFVNKDHDPMDDMGHGTHVADIAAGKGTPKGVAPDATLFAYKVCDSNGNCETSNILAAIERSIDPNQDKDFSDHMNVINISLGGEGNPEDSQSTAVNNAVKAGIVVVVSAGNSGPWENSIGSPGTAKDAITVGASDKNDKYASFSSRGLVTWKKANGNQGIELKPDIMAPGVDICAARWGQAFAQEGKSCSNDDKHIAISGTSMAAPHVSGEAALILEKNPDWSPLEIKAAIKWGAIKIENTGYDYQIQGNGRIVATAAIKLKQTAISKINPIGELNGNVINITGSAYARRSPLWNLSICNESGGFYGSDSCNTIATSSVSVTDGILYSNFDPKRYNEGLYSILLSVMNSNGVTIKDREILHINNLAITSIGNNNYVNSKPQVVRGFINIPNIAQYRVVVDTKFKRITVCNGFQIPTNGILCTADFSQFENGKYSVFLEYITNDSQFWKSDEGFNIAVVKEMLDGWPKHFVGFSAGSGFLMKNETNQENKYVFPYFSFCYEGGFCEYPIYYYLYDRLGVSKTLYSLSDGTDIPDAYMPATFLNDAEKKDLIISKYDKGPDKISIFDGNGKVYSTHESNRAILTFPGALINRDGKLGYFSVEREFNDNSSKISGYDMKGDSLSNFPINLDSGQDKLETISGRLTILDNGKNRNFSIVRAKAVYNDQGLATELKLYNNVYSGTNDLIKSQLIYDNLGKTVLLDSLSYASGDLFQDGKTELVLAVTLVDWELFSVNRFDPKAYIVKEFVIDSQGNIISAKDNIYGYVASNIVIGRLKNGKPTILTTLSDTWALKNGKIVASDSSLGSLFEINLERRAYYTLVGDIDGNGNSEIIVLQSTSPYPDSNPAKVLIYDNSGVLNKSIIIPTFGSEDRLIYPTLGTFDRKNTHLIIQSIVDPLDIHTGFNNKYSANIYALDLGPNPNLSKSSFSFDWPKLFHDNQNTNCFGCLASSSDYVEDKSPARINIVNDSSSPFLKMTFDEKGNEVSLKANFSVLVTANSKDIYIPVNGGFTVVDVTDGKNLMTRTATYSKPQEVEFNSDRRYYVLKANQNAKFEISESFNPLIMFAGSYYAKLSYAMIGTSPDDIKRIGLPNNNTNLVTIIGERSPYIQSISPNPVVSNSLVTINGVRFQPDQNVVQISNENGLIVFRKTVSSFKGKQIQFTPSLPGGHYVLSVVSPVTGASNNVSINIESSVQPQPLPTSVKRMSGSSVSQDPVIMQPIMPESSQP